MPAGILAARVAELLARLHREPSRTWSIVVTVYGDAILPRGGSVWLGTLLAFFEALGTGEGAVRTAMSRLAQDGWLERNRVGRRSFYRLAERGRATFAAATAHIYHPSPPVWDGRFDLVRPLDGPTRDTVAGALIEAGYGDAAPGLFVAPAGAALPRPGPLSFRLDAHADAASARALAARAWPLGWAAEAYAAFRDAFRPLGTALAEGARLSDEEAMVVRILLIHAYRRVILRDPLLPAELLPGDWPGHGARDLCAVLYRAVLDGSERWLDRHGANEAGPLPPAGPELRRRFT